ncbi:hypothetical protein CKK33_17440 [Mucilaginibacter sp. MD40]|uniref:TlpA family protein disulfide reductase n=1 Tax=Mucilaginibacter sp. MD40 TaxID=2029590 RepID=UPI000BAC688F|nr:TlpA family protein disulfide reductase [Mucilaginibacter sp. MD40]PAW95186.1 hypothetical protein CKK33_17440 [Mucilaginibacter sp. MD40]
MKRYLIIMIGIVLSIISNQCAAQIKPMVIGEKLPENLYSHLKKYIAINEGNAILIDFWATWCAPCVSSLPYLDSLQTNFKNKLQVISVTRENDKTVHEVIKKVFSNKQPAFSILLKDTLTEKFFPHQTIPHCIWIDKNGVIKAITDKPEVTFRNVQNLISGINLDITNKPQTIKYDDNKPPYASKQIRLEDEFLYHSMITKYRDDLNSEYSRGTHNDFISCINSPIIRLYQCAFGKFDLSYWDMNRVICLGFNTFADSVKLGIFTSERLIHEWQNNIQKNAFSYEFATKDSIFSNKEIFQIMAEDLNRYFATMGIKASLEKRVINTLALTQIGNNKSYQNIAGGKSSHYTTSSYMKIENLPMSYFLSQIKPFINNNNLVIVNETGYDGNIDISLNKLNNNFLDLNGDLEKYGLKFVEKKSTTDVIVVKKTNIIHGISN